MLNRLLWCAQCVYLVVNTSPIWILLCNHIILKSIVLKDECSQAPESTPQYSPMDTDAAVSLFRAS